MLGTLADRERRDPVVVVSGDRDLLQLVRDEPVPVRVLYLGRGLAKATKCGPGGGRRDLRRARSTGPVPPTPNWHCCAAIRPTDCPASPASARRRPPTLLAQHGSLEDILAAAHDPKSKLSKAHRTKLLAATDYIEAAGPGGRVAIDADVNCLNADRRAAAGRRASAQGRRTRGATTASRRRSADCRRHSTRCPAASATWAGRPRRCRCRPGTSPSPVAWCRRC